MSGAERRGIEQPTTIAASIASMDWKDRASIRSSETGGFPPGRYHGVMQTTDFPDVMRLHGFAPVVVGPMHAYRRAFPVGDAQVEVLLTGTPGVSGIATPERMDQPCEVGLIVDDRLVLRLSATPEQVLALRISEG